MTQRDGMVELKQLRLHGMAGAWANLAEQGGGGGGGAALDASLWLIEHLLQAEGTERARAKTSSQRAAGGS